MLTKSPAKLIFFDLDGTLLDGLEYSWQLLWDHFGIEKELVRKPIKQFHDHQITYQEWVDYDIELLKQKRATRADIATAFRNVSIMKGATEALTELKRYNYALFIVSGGINVLVEETLKKYVDLFDNIFINVLQFDDKGYLVGGLSTPYDQGHKATCVKNTAAKYNLGTAECVFIGDNSNDVQAALLAGVSIAFNSKSDELVEAATHQVKGNDLRKILPLLI